MEQRRQPREVVFAEHRVPGDYSWRSVRLTEAGTLEIIGHDIGSTVEAHFGGGEHEFVRTVPADGVAALRTALALPQGTDLLPYLRDRFATTFALEQFLEQRGVETSFWSRVGS